MWHVLKLVAVKILTVLEMKSVALSLVVVSQEKNVSHFVIQETVPLMQSVQPEITGRLADVGTP